MNLQAGVILASVRQGRRGEAFAHWIHHLTSQRPEVSAELLDLKDWPFPSYDSRDNPLTQEKRYPPGSLGRRWAEKIASLDTLVIVTPEYNHGYPGSLKNAIDHVYTPWNHKPVAFISYGGFAGGARAVEQLRLVAVELRMLPVRDEVNLSLIGFAGDERGWPKEERFAKRAAAMLDELLWLGRVIKAGRAQHPR